MGRHLFKLSKYGRLDISVKVYDGNDNIIKVSETTYDSKPTIKEVINKNYIPNATKMVISSTPSCETRTYKII